MKRTASGAGLDGSEGEGRKSAKSTAGGSDAGGSSAPHSPVSADNSTSPTASENVTTAEKLSQEHHRSAGKGKNAMSSGGKKGGTGPRVPLSSPLGSDDEGEGKSRGGGGGGGDKGGGTQDDDDEEEEREERMENLELGKYITVDTDRMQQVLNRFTPEQMSRYECYRRSGFQRANMRRLLGSVAGCPISIPMTIVMSGISKMKTRKGLEQLILTCNIRENCHDRAGRCGANQAMPHKGGISKTEAGRQSTNPRESATF